MTCLTLLFLMPLGAEPPVPDVSVQAAAAAEQKLAELVEQLQEQHPSEATPVLEVPVGETPIAPADPPPASLPGSEITLTADVGP